MQPNIVYLYSKCHFMCILFLVHTTVLTIYSKKVVRQPVTLVSGRVKGYFCLLLQGLIMLYVILLLNEQLCRLEYCVV